MTILLLLVIPPSEFSEILPLRMTGKLDMSWIGTKHLFANLQGEEAWRKIDPSLRSG
jgi:hypothetical protein